MSGQPPAQTTDATEATTPLGKAKHTVRFYRDYYGWEMTWAVLLLGLLLTLSLMIKTVSEQNVEEVDFSVNDDGVMRQIPHSDDAAIDPNQIPLFLSESFLKSHTFNYHNFIKVRDRTREFFTDKGYQDYLSLLDEKGYQAAVLSEKLVTRGFLKEAPDLLEDPKVIDGALTWKLRVKVSLVFYAPKRQSFNRNYSAVVLVKRVGTDISDRGIQIDRIILD